MLKYILPAILSFLAISVYAQEKEKATENLENVSVSITFFRWEFSNSIVLPDLSGKFKETKVKASNNARSLYYKIGDNYRKLNISSGQTSPAFQYEGPRNMEIYSREDSGEYKKVSTMIIPPNVNEVFALMLKKGRSWNFLAINVSPKRLPKGKVAVINMTSHHVALFVGGDVKLVRAGANAVFSKKKKASIVEFQIARMIERKWRPVYKNNVSIPEDQRCLVLLYDPSNKKSPKFNIQMLTL